MDRLKRKCLAIGFFMLAYIIMSVMYGLPVVGGAICGAGIMAMVSVLLDEIKDE